MTLPVYLRLVSIAALVGIGAASVQVQAQAQTRQERLQEHVFFLAADSLRGRAAGTPDATRAAEYIIRQYEQAGLKPLFREGWYDHFEAGSFPERDFKNVVGLIEGTDPALRGECIVLGAHYDHLGVRGGKIYNGADDNASGSAAVIEIARALAGQRLRRSVIIAAFDGEELGLYGSSHLAGKLDSLHFNVKLMMSVDMVGWLREGKALKLEGVATIKDGREILSAQAGTLTLSLKNFERSVFTATDTEGFALLGIPTLAVTTGLKSPYHKPEDDADLIDYEGLDQVTGYLSDLTEDLATRERFTSSGRVAPKHKIYSDYGVDFALVAGYSRGGLRFPRAAFDGKEFPAWNLGAEAQLNLGHFGLRTQVLYDRFNARYPAPADFFGSAIRIHQDELCVPLSLVFQSRRSQMAAGSAFLGAGPYYARRLACHISGGSGLESAPADGSGLEPALNQWGLNYTVGVRMGALQIGVLYLRQIGRFFPDPAAPDTRRSTAMAQFKYIF